MGSTPELGWVDDNRLTSEAPFPPEEPVEPVIDGSQVVDTPRPQDPLAIPVMTRIDPLSDPEYALKVQNVIGGQGTSEAPFPPAKDAPYWYSGPETIVKGPDGKPVIGTVDLRRERIKYSAALANLGSTANN